MNRLCILPLLCSLASAQTVILDMDTVRHRPTEVTTRDKTKAPAGTAELVDGRFGRAVRFSFVEAASPGFMVAAVRGSDEWDRAAGLSFWVKGDGSANWGGIELIDRSDFRLRYGYCFPIDSTEWRKVVVPWRDLVPELDGPLVDAGRGFAPSRFGNLWFGKWFYWREYPAVSYTIDQVALEDRVEIDATDYAPREPPLARILAKLKEKKPLTIVTMGDSLSDKRHWANREVLWSELLAKRLGEQFGGEVRLVNPAIGGTTLSQNTILIPRWLKDTPAPDLVTIWFGYNDWDSGVRGQRFREYLSYVVDRLRRETRGRSDILLMTTCPAHGRWETMKELEQAASQVAADRKTGLADPAAEFRRTGSPDEALRRNYWAWDKCHLGSKGHELVADIVLRAITGRPDGI